MIARRIITTIVFLGVALLGGITAQAEPAHNVIDRLNVPGPIRFGETDYRLAWSSHPSPGYFKQEYVPAGQKVERFEVMILIELAMGRSLKDTVTAQVAMLKDRKKTDPVTNMSLMAKENTDEIILDFVMQARGADGTLITEWNAYRYKPHTTLSGKGVVLFAISKRAYGDDEGMAFLKALWANRQADLNMLAASTFPAVSGVK